MPPSSAALRKKSQQNLLYNSFPTKLSSQFPKCHTHRPVFTCEEAEKYSNHLFYHYGEKNGDANDASPTPQRPHFAKNLFLRAAAKKGSQRQHYLLCAKDSQPTNLNRIKKLLKCKNLRLESAERLWDVCKVRQGSVSVFCVFPTLYETYEEFREMQMRELARIRESGEEWASEGGDDDDANLHEAEDLEQEQNEDHDRHLLYQQKDWEALRGLSLILDRSLWYYDASEKGGNQEKQQQHDGTTENQDEEKSPTNQQSQDSKLLKEKEAPTVAAAEDSSASPSSTTENDTPEPSPSHIIFHPLSNDASCAISMPLFHLFVKKCHLRRVIIVDFDTYEILEEIGE